MRAIVFNIVLVSTLIAIITISLCQASSSQVKKRVKLRDLTALTLTKGEWTTGRRSRPVPQLQCVGGTARCAFLPKTVQCYNRGSDGVDIQWECVADLDNNLRFGSLEVTCEGYDYPEDDYVLIGSCGLEYTIDSLDGSSPKKPYFNKPPVFPSQRKEGTSIFFIIAIIGAIFIIYFMCLRVTPERVNPTPSAPPPPGFREDFFGSSSPPQPEETNRRSSTNTNFWTGLGLGGLGGYLFGRRTPTNYSDQSSYFTRHQRPHFTSDFARDDTYSSSHTSASPSHTSSSGSRSASGFGGTKRR